MAEEEEEQEGGGQGDGEGEKKEEKKEEQRGKKEALIFLQGLRKFYTRPRDEYGYS